LRRLLVIAALAAALLAPAKAVAATWAVGVPALPGAKMLLPGRAVTVESPTRPHVPGAAFVERLDGVRRLAFDNTEPLAARQWYLQQDAAWDFWPEAPRLLTTKVAVIDSGVDGEHPELVNRVVAAKSFVGGSPYKDTEGHGTFVAGLIAANPFNGEGIAGLAFNAQLVVAKVVQPDGSVSLQGEVEAIRWAVDEAGAQVLNLSLGGVRDPFNPKIDTYSPLEQAAIDYAYSKGAIVVAAVGNGPQSPATPWNHAHYPAALPHVIGVSAVRENGSVPDYSNRDPVYNDLAAPGDAILSTIPRNLVEDRPGCADHPYSDCGPFEFRNAIGTSFAAPQVSAAAALILGAYPDLQPDQVMWLLERSAADEDASTGCPRCAVGRDALSGWGRLNVLGALQYVANGSALPRPDLYEPNDDAGAWARAYGPPRAITATLDYWDDQIDVFAVTLGKGQRLYARLSPPAHTPIKVLLWKPRTRRVEGLQAPLSQRAAQSALVAGQERLFYKAKDTGRYYVEVKVVVPTHTPAVYKLALATRR
jgi:subtilisin family serine protease